jgi:hypothetical protein
MNLINPFFGGIPTCHGSVIETFGAGGGAI